MMDFSIRLGVNNDQDSLLISEITKAAFGNETYGGEPLGNVFPRNLSYPGHDVYISSEGQKAIGFLVMARNCPRKNGTYPMYVLTLAVLPEYQRKGVGTSLLALGLQWCRFVMPEVRAETIHAHIRESNRRSQTLFARMGFRHDPVFDGKYDPVNAEGEYAAAGERETAMHYVRTITFLPQ